MNLVTSTIGLFILFQFRDGISEATLDNYQVRDCVDYWLQHNTKS